MPQTVQHIVLDNPPVNGLGWELRKQLFEQLGTALANPEVLGVVIRGDGRMFCGGADVRQFGTPKMGQEPLLRDINHLIDSANKPVIAAIHGYALGGGLELAMACHARVAESTVLVGLPEVTLGIVPGGGGTQRLPRLVGVEQALEMILTGRRISAPDALAIGLLDQVVDEHQLHPVAQQLAKELSAGPLEALRSRSACNRICGRAEETTHSAIIRNARARCAAEFSGRNSPVAAVECVQAGIEQSFEDALTFERETFLRLVDSEEAVNARAAFTKR